jgi:glucans biosynthesis protein
VWVEPKDGWGKGSVQLVELPTEDETFDNIVAFWNPAETPVPGRELRFSYRLHWGAQMPVGSGLARVVATRTGIGGVVGRKRNYFSWRFVVDFAGANLAMIGKDVRVDAVISVSRGRVELSSARPLDSARGFRAMFDLVPAEDSVAPVDVRMYLRADGEPLSETWVYQWTPPATRRQ